MYAIICIYICIIYVFIYVFIYIFYVFNDKGYNLDTS